MGQAHPSCHRSGVAHCVLYGTLVFLTTSEIVLLYPLWYFTIMTFSSHYSSGPPCIEPQDLGGYVIALPSRAS